jgi:hypothetical protein
LGDRPGERQIAYEIVCKHPTDPDRRGKVLVIVTEKVDRHVEMMTPINCSAFVDAPAGPSKHLEIICITRLDTPVINVFKQELDGKYLR